MKLSQAIGISLGFALFAAISACKDDSANLRSNQNPPRPVPGPGVGFVTSPQKSNSNTNSQNENPTTTNMATNESDLEEDQ